MGIDRLAAAAAAYRQQYGTWPREATINSGTLASFEDDLGDAGMRDLGTRLTITETDEGGVTVTGPEGDLEYDGAAWDDGADHVDAAFAWLRGEDRRDDAA